MSDRDTKLLLEDISEAIRKILTYTYGMTFNDFRNDSKTVDAVVRNFAVIGEAANKIPDAFRTAHPKIEWKRIRGFRNRIVHEYFDVDYEMVWQIKEENLAGFEKKISLLLSKL